MPVLYDGQCQHEGNGGQPEVITPTHTAALKTKLEEARTELERKYESGAGGRPAPLTCLVLQRPHAVTPNSQRE
jgi:hypothetical protein